MREEEEVDVMDLPNRVERVMIDAAKSTSEGKRAECYFSLFWVFCWERKGRDLIDSECCNAGSSKE